MVINLLNDEIGDIKDSFSDGVDELYNSLVALGVSPSEKTLSACTTAVQGIKKNPKTGRVTDMYLDNDVNWKVPTGYYTGNPSVYQSLESLGLVKKSEASISPDKVSVILSGAVGIGSCETGERYGGSIKFTTVTGANYIIKLNVGGRREKQDITYKNSDNSAWLEAVTITGNANTHMYNGAVFTASSAREVVFTCRATSTHSNANPQMTRTVVEILP